MDKHGQVFLEEANELLADLESALLELEERPDDRDLIGRIFRAMHTIKGSGAMFGFTAVSRFTHELETAFDLVRNDRMAVSRELIDLTLTARDRIKTMLAAPGAPDPELDRKNDALIAQLKDLTPGSGAPAAQAAAATAPKTDDGAPTTYRITFRPSKRMFQTGGNPLLLLEELRGLGECTVTALADAVPDLDHLNPVECHIAWHLLLTTGRGLDAVKDVFLFVQDDADLGIEAAETLDPDAPADAAGAKRLGDILLERGDVSPEAMKEALSSQKRLGRILVDMGAVNADTVASALAEQEHARGVREKRRMEESALSVRVPAEKLDRLVDLVGELVTVQARLSQAAGGKRRGGADFLPIAEEVERLTAELRDSAMSIRMLPIGTTFSRFKRLVRDLSTELGKEIELTTEGAETELDKTVIERLGDPMVHLIRNSIDHGIESPEQRAAAGKARRGRIHLSAVHSGAHVLIRIEDDGAGVDPAAIRATAVEKGLIAEGAALTEQESYALLFAPGFSTAKTITNVSGRGVGMDVVKKTVNALRGSIELDSRAGAGTTVTLKLPLTLAIIDGFLTKIGAEHFVFPLSLVEECVELTAHGRRDARGGNLANVRGRLVPYLRLRDRFLMQDAGPEVEQIVIARVNDRRVGFVVDHIIGSHQTVIKNLGKFFHEAEGVSGATILGDGTVALILDVPKLVSEAERVQ